MGVYTEGPDASMIGENLRGFLKVHEEGQQEALLEGQFNMVAASPRKSPRFAFIARRNRRMLITTIIFIAITVFITAILFRNSYDTDHVIQVVRSIRQADLFSNYARCDFLSDKLSCEEETYDDYGPYVGAAGEGSYSPCSIAFADSATKVQEPTDWSVFQSFSLHYIQSEDKPERDSLWEPRFGGHQSLGQREASYRIARNEPLHCGFVKLGGYPETGFNFTFQISKEDIDYMHTCRIVVSSCIFGNIDHLHEPNAEKISSSTLEKVCFALFVDQQSLDGMIEEGHVPDAKMTVGLWRVVLVTNLPYADSRRNGKVPKFLGHRLFPNTEYSIWLDGKLRLETDPLLVLDHFLWRGNYEYALSDHFFRHALWEEVSENKRLNKYDNVKIDEQFEFYRKHGLPPFKASDPHKLLSSYVPEGSLILRAHTPMSNLFSCLWFNEVDRFTPRDQLSFAFTYLKFVRSNPFRPFRLSMFKDCERREMAAWLGHK